MKTVNIIAADPMPHHCTQPEKVMIKIECEASEYTKNFKTVDLKAVQEFFEQEAEKLFQALINALPQGVIEPLTIKFLQHRVSLYHGVMK